MEEKLKQKIIDLEKEVQKWKGFYENEVETNAEVQNDLHLKLADLQQPLPLNDLEQMVYTIRDLQTRLRDLQKSYDLEIMQKTTKTS